MASFTWPWTPIEWPNILVQVAYLLETKLSYEFLEPLIGFLAHLDQKLCHKNKKMAKIPTPIKSNQGGITPLLYLAITCR